MTSYSLLRKSRIIIALALFILVFLVFNDLYEWVSSDTVRTVLSFQFVPSLLTFLATFSLIAGGGFLLILLLTFITGRVYCSYICPLGILQDIINRIARQFSKKKRFFRFKKGYPVLRYTFLGIMILALILGLGWITVWLDPYSITGRAFTYLLKPLIVWGNNKIAVPLFHSMEIYSFYRHNLLHPYIMPVILSLAVIVAIGYFAWKRGRLFCNTICPVGSFLGIVSKFSLYRVRFDKNKCTRCGKCAGVCKSECIDIKNYSVDNSRCVVCFNCLDICPEAALSMRPASKPVTTESYSSAAGAGPVIDGSNRRKLLITILALLAGNRIYALKKNRMPDNQKDLLINEKEHPVAPPGAGTIERFNKICTGCSLCVSACPTGVLQPALTEYGLAGFMQPHMDYLTNYCNFDCTKCGEVCPTEAILPLSIEDKHITQIGKAFFIKQNCIVYTDETDCGACSEHCPTKAVKMVPYKNGLLIPEVEQDICVGCGACEHACPVEAPFKAIYVDGNAVQQFAERPVIKELKEQGSEEDFPF
jgi:ferredoxin-type protein NapF